MADTLTYQNDSDPVTAEETLTAEEQESLKVGEALQEQQQQLLAGKYKDAEELEKAYVELQKKLEKKVLKIARILGNPQIRKTEKNLQKKRKKLRKILQQFP